MRKLMAVGVGLIALVLLAPIGAWAQTNGARAGSVLGGPAPLPNPEPDATLDFTEGFDDITVLPGWFMQNNSSPLGVTGWFQGNDTVFPAQAGAPTAYIGANFNNTSGVGTISNWLLTPEINLPVGEFCFYTRTADGSIWPDRLQVRLSTNGASTNVGALATDVGDFTNLLVDVNATYVVGGYPEAWQQFCTGAVAGSGTGRLAFRYFVENGGPVGDNSNYIGIDTVAFTEGVADADLEMTKTGNAAGTNIIWTVTVTNNGPGDATNVVVTDTLDACTTYVSDDCGGANAPPWTWNVGGLLNGASAICNITVDASACVGAVSNTAAAAGDQNDPTPANNSDTTSVTAGSVILIPTLNTVGLALLALLLAGGALLVMRRRRAV